MATRREFMTGSAGAIATLASSKVPAAHTGAQSCAAEVVSLCGDWLFRPDPDNAGTPEGWFGSSNREEAWRKVHVPHTWQVEPALVDYRGIAWYFRPFEVPERWGHCAVRVEFEAVFHSATVWVNGEIAGEHARKGYTAFTIDITKAIRVGRTNIIALRVDNAFNQNMVPRGRSSDWAHDGGIFRPVQILVTPSTFVERVDVDAVPNLASGDAKLTIVAFIRNASTDLWEGGVSFRVAEENSSSAVCTCPASEAFSIEPQTVRRVSCETTLPNARLWHFDGPNLYQLECSISNDKNSHQFTTIFGVRKFEIREGAFHLNGERVRLMGVERMAGSNPQFGMAEPVAWVNHDHDDMKHLNCVFTRVHWPQDRRVLDYCDRHGILMQAEVPAWGPDTFAGMTAQPSEDILQNGLEQLREMIARDRNHPSVIAWGLCNEVNGKNPPAYQFAKRMLEEAKSLDSGRLCSYASNSLADTPQNDVAALMDFIETNEYYGTWAPGTADDAARHLDALHAAFPDKPIVVSEYGYCACTPDRPEGDEKRMDILRTHQNAIRSRDFVAGAIFFCYNDYRTHVGDRGLGYYRQRVHGVVDVEGSRKPSYELLRDESSPVESLTITVSGNRFEVQIKTRRDFPMYTLQSYKLRGIFFGQGNIPVEQQEVTLPQRAPGSEARLELTFSSSEPPVRVHIDVLRPTGFSVYSQDWTGDPLTLSEA
jgi:beta-galactosidase